MECNFNISALLLSHYSGVELKNKSSLGPEKHYYI